MRMSAQSRTAITCPACGHEIDRGQQRRMNSPLLGKPRVVACVGCRQPLQWHRSLHARMFLSGLLFRIGALAFVIVFVLGQFIPVVALHVDTLMLASVVLAAVGILGTATRASSAFVEVASSDA